MHSKKSQIFITAIFLLAISIPLILSDKMGGKVSKIENRTLAAFPNILSQDMTLSGVKSGLENWIKDNFGFRTQIKYLQSRMDFDLFHVSPSSAVVAGKEGWYYYALDRNLDLALGTYPVSDDQLIRIKQNQEGIQKALNDKGIEYVIVLIPSKVSVYPEYLWGNFTVRKTAIDIVSDYLKENTTIPVINLKPDLLEAKKEGLVYFKADTHWNQTGNYIGYCSIIKKLNDLGIVSSLPASIKTFPGTRAGDLTAIMGIPDLFTPEPIEAIELASPSAIPITQGDYYTSLGEMVKKEGIYKPIYSFNNDMVERKKLLIYGDSFFAGFNMPGMLAENFSNVDYIWSVTIMNELVEFVRPDVVMLEMTERSIIAMTLGPDPELVPAP